MSGTTDRSPSGRGCSHGGKGGFVCMCLCVCEEEEKEEDEMADNTCVSDIQTLIHTHKHTHVETKKKKKKILQWRRRLDSEATACLQLDRLWRRCGLVCCISTVLMTLMTLNCFSAHVTLEPDTYSCWQAYSDTHAKKKRCPQTETCPLLL